MANGADSFAGGKFTGISALHRRYDRWLTAALRRRFGCQDSDDLAQDTWLRLASIENPAELRHPKAFLLRVAMNLAANRHHRRRLRVRAEGLAAPLDRFEADQADRVLLTQIVLSLPEPLRDVFLLSRLDGLTNAQIGERLGISPKTVEWRMTRALAHCAAQLRR
ncbi:MAG: RNA polymerase sigma factor [Alphaproteobacteria bacterium]|uniref:RNA polymerase sigma factor n=1 Tax=Brevundimonas aurifodinae TaxID=1508312 RepID=UPI001D68D054|nr:RNA polymerase sigma factor [Alphaproteobacteria bacterium]MBU2040845.1 RNA polymerase sigma factor [Alphaproteobacteria bacterium]MBU2127311.1 RNA polymerase sigma factor [Alphaproteobacteria bacterium]MBU2207731.1 RNA polymerase sigma factor [Alphaproteobacteria bacterium]MBU2291069.1 RNA polymerase sigma factor [Alphaproteobacteria bacterium]